MDTQKSIEALQFFITNLHAQAFSHKLQSYIFKAKGYEKTRDHVSGPQYRRTRSC